MKSTKIRTMKSSFIIVALIVSIIAWMGSSCNNGNQAGSDSLQVDEPSAEAPRTDQSAEQAETPKISEEEAAKIALKAVPGEVTAVAIENKLGGDRYVVEVIAKADGVETDVIIDMETGQVLGIEK